MNGSNILVAVSDRDLLSGLSDYLEITGNSVSQAFDGIQAISRMAESKFDAAIIDCDLPRIKLKDILNALKDSGTPSIVLTKAPVSPKLLAKEPVPASYLSYPFLPEELTAKTEDVIRTASEGKPFDVCGVTVDPSEFLLSGRVKLTLEELNTFSSVSCGTPPDERRTDILVDSLNKKLSSVAAPFHIEYTISKGYNLVTEDE
ncbi:MAG: response regulator transcription factor [Clostridia bacterium]|nr:response regulator transcription factor [Clostridia bacterium]